MWKPVIRDEKRYKIFFVFRLFDLVTTGPEDIALVGQLRR
jgi:hypothetical protein